jgi:hypothetical protein
MTPQSATLNTFEKQSDDKYQTQHIIAIEGCQLMMREMKKPHNL